MLLGGIGLTVPPQTRHMLAFLDGDRIWPAISFQIAMIVRAGSAWFWSRVALAARFGIDDRRQSDPATPNFRLYSLHLAATLHSHCTRPGDQRNRAAPVNSYALGLGGGSSITSGG
jgi:hypothetical protein